MLLLGGRGRRDDACGDVVIGKAPPDQFLKLAIVAAIDVEVDSQLPLTKRPGDLCFGGWNLEN
jgi:hypothetical protein